MCWLHVCPSGAGLLDNLHRALILELKEIYLTWLLITGIRPPAKGVQLTFDQAFGAESSLATVQPFK